VPIRISVGSSPCPEKKVMAIGIGCSILVGPALGGSTEEAPSDHPRDPV